MATEGVIVIKMNHRSSAVDTSLDFRGSNNETPAKIGGNQKQSKTQQSISNFQRKITFNSNVKNSHYINCVYFLVFCYCINLKTSR